MYLGEHAWADFDETGAITSRYLYGDSIDKLLAREKTGEGYGGYLVDHLGTVEDVVNISSESLVEDPEYAAFGSIGGDRDVKDRLRFTGRKWDSETGLYYYRARYYLPTLGRFVSEAPLR